MDSRCGSDDAAEHLRCERILRVKDHRFGQEGIECQSGILRLQVKCRLDIGASQELEIGYWYWDSLDRDTPDYQELPYQ